MPCIQFTKPSTRSSASQRSTLQPPANSRATLFTVQCSRKRLSLRRTDSWWGLTTSGKWNMESVEPDTSA